MTSKKGTGKESIPAKRADRRQLQQIIADLTEGIILIDLDRTIVWANQEH